MGIKAYTLLQPQYLADFYCVGAACEANCCKADWDIFIDKTTYEKYRKVSQREWRIKFAKYIKRRRLKASANAYARIALIDGCCPFFDSQDSLCEIQKFFGVDNLSVTCLAYPRIANVVNDRVEISLSMSCPAAIRKGLLNPEYMVFDQYVTELDQKRMHIQKFFSGSTINQTFQQKLFPYFEILRTFTISLLQNRKYAIWQRLVLLGLVYQNIDKLINRNEQQEILKILEQYLEFLNGDEAESLLSEIPQQITIQMEILKELAETRFSMGRMHYNFLSCFGKFMASVLYVDETQKDKIAERYKMNFDMYYAPFMNQHEYILENYLVNYTFQNLFPLSELDTLFDNYVLLVLHYSLIKMLLIGSAGFSKEMFGIDQIVEVIQVYSQEIEHSPVFIQHLMKMIKDNSMNTLPYMAVLARN